MNAKELLIKAKNEGYAIGAFNACNVETLKAIVYTAKKLNAPVLIEASDGEAEYIGKKELAALIRIYRQDLQIPIILNLDHAPSLDSCVSAIEAGFDYVHFDGSKLPFEENVKIAKEVVLYAHSKGVLVEGEIDHIEGSSADHTKEDPKTYQAASHYTNPDQAYEFIKETGVDTFASFIGNLHGLYAKEIRLKLDILEKIKQKIPNTFLSLHGGSGLNPDDVRNAVKSGIVKVNVNSELRIAFKNTLQKTLNENSEVAIYKLTPPAISAVAQIVEQKIDIFGSGGKI